MGLLVIPQRIFGLFKGMDLSASEYFSLRSANINVYIEILRILETLSTAITRQISSTILWNVYGYFFTHLQQCLKMNVCHLGSAILYTWVTFFLRVVSFFLMAFFNVMFKKVNNEICSKTSFSFKDPVL